MNITVNELLQGKGTIIKNKEYFATKTYVKPFIDYMSTFTDDFRVTVKLPNQITVGNVQDITYNRVLMEAVLPKEHDVDGHSEVIAFLYGLDVRKPICKIYRGYLNKDNNNLIAFDSNMINIQEVEPEEILKYTIKPLMETTSTFPDKVKSLKSKTLSKDEVLVAFGKWVDFSLTRWHYNGLHNVKLSPNVAIESYKSLFVDKDSDYFKDSAETATLYEIYNAFAQNVTNDDKDIMNRFEKTVLINQLLEVK